MSIPDLRHSLSLASAAVMALFVAATASSASAAVISYSAVVSYSHDTPQSPVPFSDSFTLPSFDPSLGTLTGVTIGATTTATAAVDVFNSTSTAKRFSAATATIPLTVDAPDGVTLNIVGVAGPVSGTAAPGFSDHPGNTASASGSIVVPTGDFAAFVGMVPGEYSADFGTSTFTGSAAPGVYFSGSAVAGGTTTVTYTYTAAPTPPPATVPEPASMALLGGGLLCMGLFLTTRSRT